MRSTPIILDRLRHIKYDLQAIWDMDYLMDGGFNNILDKEVTPELCQMLLWFGLRSEDPYLTMEDTKKLMENAGVGESKTELIKAFAVCSQELFNSGYLTKLEETDKSEQEPQKEKKEFSTKSLILEFVRLAQESGIVDTEKIWNLTPVEITDLYKTIKGEKDYRMGTICAVIMNSAGFKKDDGWFTWQDFVPHETKPQTPKEMGEIINSMNAMFGGT